MPMVAGATLMMPDGGSTRPGATASQRLSLCCADAAVAGEPPSRPGGAITAMAAAIRARPRTIAMAVLRFDMLMPFRQYLKISAPRRRILHGRYCHPRCGRYGRRTASAADRG